jgi:hypothetical protein
MLARNDNQPPADKQSSDFIKSVKTASELRAECPQFRILIIGKANAGKTTILRKVCNATPDIEPNIYDAEGNEIVPIKPKWFKKIFKQPRQSQSQQHLEPSTGRGEHNIEHQITFPGSNFIFHDSRGIEAGGEDELQTVMSFIQKRSKQPELRDQLHAIWYCIPMDDTRPVSGAEADFFKFGTGRGRKTSAVHVDYSEKVTINSASHSHLHKV